MRILSTSIKALVAVALAGAAFAASAAPVRHDGAYASHHRVVHHHHRHHHRMHRMPVRHR